MNEKRPNTHIEKDKQWYGTKSVHWFGVSVLSTFLCTSFDYVVGDKYMYTNILPIFVYFFRTENSLRLYTHERVTGDGKKKKIHVPLLSSTQRILENSAHRRFYTRFKFSENTAFNDIKSCMSVIKNTCLHCREK